MKYKLLLIISAAFFLFPGCSKDSTSSGYMQLSKIYAGGQLQSEYSYNSKGQLLNHTLYSFPGRKTSEITCYYDVANRLTKKESAFDFSSGPNPQWSYSYTEYSYTPDGKISEEKNYLKQNNIYVLTSKIKPGYDADGKLISRTLLLPNDVPAKLSKYQYDSKRNIILQEEYQYNGATPELHFKYSYDDFDSKKNPYMSLNSTVPPFSININNILKTTITNYIITPGTPVVTTTNVVYTSYNSKGFPVKVNESGTDFTYEYK